MSKKQAVATTEENKLPVAAFDFGGHEGAGREGADRDSYAIPFISVIQKMSPICDEADGSYNPDAKPGMLMNTVTGQLYDGKEGIVILPCHYQRRFLRWGPRDAGGGFKGEILPEKVAEMEEEGQVKNVDGRLFFPQDDGSVNEKKCDRLADTRNHFCILEDNGQQVLLSLGSTQIKKSKMLMSLLAAVKVATPDGRRVTPPTWANRVLLQTVLEQNDQGSWYGVKFSIDEERRLTNDRELYDAGVEFYKALQEGTAGEVRYHEAEPATQGDKF